MSTHSIIKIIAVCAVAASVQNCASSSQTGQQGDQEAVNGLNENDSGLNNASLNNNGLNNNSGKNNTAAAQGESMNNAVGGNNFASENSGNPANSETSNNLGLNGSSSNPLVNGGTNPLANGSNATAVPLNQSAPLNNGSGLSQNPATNLAGNTAPIGEAPPINGAPVNAAAQPAPTAPQSADVPVANWDKMNNSPFTNPQMNWPGRGKVKYITRKVTKHATPDGPVVGEYNVGNHPLVYQNGNWLELSNGTYIRGNAATDRPVGYPRSGANSGSYSH